MVLLKVCVQGIFNKMQNTHDKNLSTKEKKSVLLYTMIQVFNLKTLYTYKQHANVLIVIITGLEGYSDLFILFFVLFCFLYCSIQTYTLCIILSIFKRREKIFRTRYSYVILDKLVMMMTTLY